MVLAMARRVHSPWEARRWREESVLPSMSQRGLCHSDQGCHLCKNYGYDTRNFMYMDIYIHTYMYT